MGEKSKEHPKSRNNFDEEEYSLRKRLPRKYPKRKNDIYVTRQTNFQAQLERCQSLLDGGFIEIFIHGLGAAINRSINLALQLKTKNHGSLSLESNTSTVELKDDLIPEKDNLEPDLISRNNSAMHIRVHRIQQGTQSTEKDC